MGKCGSLLLYTVQEIHRWALSSGNFLCNRSPAPDHFTLALYRYQVVGVVGGLAQESLVGEPRE